LILQSLVREICASSTTVRTIVRHDRHGVVEQTKFDASFGSPEPRYLAMAGYGHSGRL
jgi:hypothetical protein